MATSKKRGWIKWLQADDDIIRLCLKMDLSGKALAREFRKKALTNRSAKAIQHRAAMILRADAENKTDDISAANTVLATDSTSAVNELRAAFPTAARIILDFERGEMTVEKMTTVVVSLKG